MPGLLIDLFAGGGGASVGIERAAGRPVSLAINHDPAAVKMHEANHPHTVHRCESIYNVDPREATQGQPVDLLHASPSCTHFSRARGGTPVSRQERGLGWMILRWAAFTSPTVIICENVPEWVTWGPVRRGRPVKAKSGRYFNQLCTQLRMLGYVVEHRVLNAAEYGAPTTRKRLFLIARRDGLPITWPAPSHGPKTSTPYRTAAECIDWSDLGSSIFERKKPLAPATCRRIAAGIVRYVIEAKRPFLVQTAHGDFATRNGPRANSIDAPLGVIAKSNNHALVTAFLAKHYTGVIGQPVDKPLGTVTAVDHHSLVTGCMVRMNFGQKQWNGLGEPLSTVTAQGNHHAVVAAHLVQTGYGERDGQAPRCLNIEQPLGTVVAGGCKVALVAAFLTTYYSGGGNANAVDQPTPAIVTKARHGLVTVEIDGATYALADIRLRMLRPRELGRAQGFPSNYILTGTQAQQIGRIGNAVCPDVEEALVRANLPAQHAERAVAR